jgi:hypothetical protein
MTPLNAVRRRTARRAAVAGILTIGPIGLSACGGDDDDTPVDSILTTDSITPSGGLVTTMPTNDSTMTSDTMSPGVSTGDSMGTATTMPTASNMTDSTTAP